MPYIGHEPTNSGNFYILDDFNGLGQDGGSSTYDQNANGTIVNFKLMVAGVAITPNVDNLIVTIDGVLQHPTDAYTISGSILTFTGAPASGVDFHVVIMGQSSTVGEGSIGADELQVSGDGTNNQLLKTDGDGTFSWINQNTVTASTAVTLATARAINGVNFDGSAAITVTAAAGTLSGNTLKSTVTASSLTSVGTLTSLTVSGAPFVISNTNNGNNIDIKTTSSGSLVHAVKIHSHGLFEAKQGVSSTTATFTGDVKASGGKRFITQDTNNTSGDVRSALTMARGDGTGLAWHMKTTSAGSNAVGNLMFSREGTMASSGFNTTGAVLTLTSAGKVGIGTTSPEGLLHIDGANAVSSSLVVGDQSGTEDAAIFMLAGTGVRGCKLATRHSINGFEISMSDGDGNTSNFTPALVITDDTRNVGIGTTNPDILLVIGGDSGTGRILPSTDNVGYIGESSHRWQAIYAVNGSIQTSDERQKTEITDTSLGLGFIKQLRPVSYKWKVGGYDVGDGLEIELEPEEVDSEGNVIKTAVRGLPKKEEIAGKRNHYGLIAQEVKEVLGDTDFGGWVIDDLDDSESTQSLRYDQFISPLIKAVQELSAEVEALKNG